MNVMNPKRNRIVSLIATAILATAAPAHAAETPALDGTAPDAEEFVTMLAGCCDKCYEAAEELCGGRGVDELECEGVFECQCKFRCHDRQSAHLRILHATTVPNVEA